LFLAPAVHVAAIIGEGPQIMTWFEHFFVRELQQLLPVRPDESPQQEFRVEFGGRRSAFSKVAAAPRAI
jgi:hypothetical protein